MKKLNRTYIMGAVFLVFSVWVLWQTSMIPEKLVSNEPGPKLFPYIGHRYDCHGSTLHDF